MSGRTTSAWKRPKSKVYDYNYNLGEHYYKPQLQHMENKYAKKAGSPPKAATFAERFAADPVYGSNHGVDYRNTAERPFEGSQFTQPQRRTSLQDDLLKNFADDLPKRKPLFESSGSLNADDDDGFRFPSRPRLDFGKRLLDAAGTRDSLFGERSQAQTAGALEDPFEDPFFASRKKLLPPLSADPDFMTEDPFKKRLGANMDDDSDQLIRDFKRDSDNVVAGFRSRMQARRQQREEEASDFEAPSAIESRVDQIRARAKARMAELEDDLPALSLRTSNSANRARALLRNLQDEDEDLSSSSLGTSSRSLRITKRTVKVETE